MTSTSRIGIPYPANDPLGYLVDAEVRAYEDDQRFDLTGTGAEATPIVSTGLFIVHQHTVPKDTTEIIMNVFPHCWRRTDVGDAALESVQQIPAAELAGFVLFDNSKDSNQPTIVSHNYNSPTVFANPNNRQRDTVRGTSFLGADQPAMRNFGMLNPYALIELPSESVFRVLFRLSPVATANGIPNPFVIGDPGAGTKRIDFAGAYVTALRMPSQTYAKLKIARRLGQLGPEGSMANLPGSAKT